MSLKERSYFLSKKSYSGDQRHFMDSVIFKSSLDDKASNTLQGIVKIISDANAISRTDNDSDGWPRVVLPHQLPELLLSATGSHAAGTPVEVGAIKLTPLNYDSGKREDWKIEIITGKPTTIAGSNEMDVLHVDTADNNGLFLKAKDTEFQQGTGNQLELKDGGIQVEKLESLTASMGVVLDSSGNLAAAVASAAQINALDSIGNDKVVVSGATGLLEASPVSLAELGYLDLTTGAGTAEASKAVVLDASKQIDYLDVKTTLKKNGVEITATAAELNQIDGVTPGTVTASKVLIVDASKKLNELDVTAFKINGTAISETKIGYLDNVTADVQAQLDANTNIELNEHTTSQALSAAKVSGTAYIAVSNGGSVTFTLPDASAVRDGYFYRLTHKQNGGANSMIISKQSGDTLTNSSGADVSTETVSTEKTVMVVSNGVDTWTVI